MKLITRILLAFLTGSAALITLMGGYHFMFGSVLSEMCFFIGMSMMFFGSLRMIKNILFPKKPKSIWTKNYYRK